MFVRYITWPCSSHSGNYSSFWSDLTALQLGGYHNFHHDVMLGGNCPALHQEPGNKENTPPIIWLCTWIHQAIISVFFFHVHHFRQSLWWLQLQPNHQLSKINKQKLRNSTVKTTNVKNVKCCFSAHMCIVCQLRWKKTFHWFLNNTQIWFFWTWLFLFMFLTNS